MGFADRYPLIGGGRFSHETTTLALPSDDNYNPIITIFGGLIQINFVNNSWKLQLSLRFRRDMATDWISRKRQFFASWILHETTTLARPSDRNYRPIITIFGGLTQITFANKVRECQRSSCFRSDLAPSWISRKRQFVAFVEAPTAKSSRDVKG